MILEPNLTAVTSKAKTTLNIHKYHLHPCGSKLVLSCSERVPTSATCHSSNVSRDSSILQVFADNYPLQTLFFPHQSQHPDATLC